MRCNGCVHGLGGISDRNRIQAVATKQGDQCRPVDVGAHRLRSNWPDIDDGQFAIKKAGIAGSHLVKRGIDNAEILIMQDGGDGDYGGNLDLKRARRRKFGHKECGRR